MELLKVNIEKLFVIFALFFGIIYAVITPPFQSVDEGNHFLRSYAISEGQVISIKKENNVGSSLPESLSQLIGEYSHLEKDITEQTSFKEIKQTLTIKNNDNRIFTSYPNTALYSPVAYIPQSIAILSGKILHIPTLYMMYFARLFNLILYCILGYYAVKSIPFLKLAVFLILLSPMNVSLGASCSTDVTLIGASILFSAKILQYTFNDNINLCCLSKNLWDYILLSGLLFILALTKHNFYLIPLLFLIPKNKFGNHYIFKIFCIILPSVIGCLVWSMVVSNLYVPLNPYADMYKQLDFITGNPFKYILILLISSIVKAFRLFITSIGVLGWQDTRLDNLTYMIYPLLIWISIVYSNAKDFVMTGSKKLIIYLTAIFGYILITTYLYLAWTEVGGNIIQGLNGKYYTPLLLPVFAAITLSIKSKCSNRKINNIIYFFTALILTSGTISILTRFYNIFPYMTYQI